MIAGIMSFTFAISAHAQEAPPACEVIDVGMFENYLNCVESCIERAGQWTVRRSFCAFDCYLSLVKDGIAYLDETRVI